MKRKMTYEILEHEHLHMYSCFLNKFFSNSIRVHADFSEFSEKFRSKFQSTNQMQNSKQLFVGRGLKVLAMPQTRVRTPTLKSKV